MNLPITPMLAPAPIQFWTVLGLDQPRLIEVNGTESLSRPYSLRLRLRSESIIPLDIDRLLGSRVHARIHLPDSNPLSAALASPEVRDFCGVLTQISFNGTDDYFSYYNSKLKPRLWTLGLNRKYRFFSQKTTKEIVSEVLPTDFLIDWRLSSDLSQADSCYRNYCVQYGESDLTFISRLLEEDGLFYYFEHNHNSQPENPAEHVERMVITDHIAPVPETEVPAYRYDANRGGNREACRIRKWRDIRALVPQSIESLDRNFERPGTLVNAVYPSEGGGSVANDPPDEADSPADHSSSNDTTLTHYPSGVARRYDGVAPSGADQAAEIDKLDTTAQRDARIKVQRLALRHSICSGGGDVASLYPGCVFRVLRGTIEDIKSYYITSIHHQIRLATSVRSGTDSPRIVYRNRFHCHISTLPYRPPRRSKKPRIPGVVSATVVSDMDTATDQLCVDKYGRIKVRFPWHKDSSSPSCWIRVSQFWAGPRWGAYFWPRVGHEVVIAFEHGDPDRPIVVGSVYNAENMPPLTLPEHKLSCGIHSCSHNGNPLLNTNVVVFHDKQGAEFLQLHSETNLSVSSETKSITKSAGDAIVFRGHHWIFDPTGQGSGGGGSDATGDNDAAESNHKAGDGTGLLDFIEDLFFDFNHGDIEYGVGDSYSKKFGRNFETYFGCNIWLGCDPVEVFEWAASKAGSPIPGLLVAGLFGAAGQGATTFGGTHDIQYGKNVSIHRGAKIEKRCQSAIGSVSVEEKGNETAIDAPARCVCETAVVILLLIEFIVLLLTRIANNHDTKEWNGFLKFGDIWSRYFLPRIQGLIETAETTLGRLDVATAEADGTLEQSIDALKRSLRALVSTDGLASASVSAAVSEIEIAADAVRNSINRLKAAVIEMAGLA